MEATLTLIRKLIFKCRQFLIILYRISIYAFLTVCAVPAWAVGEILPGAIAPGRVYQQSVQQAPNLPQVRPPSAPTRPAPTQTLAGAEKLKFPLKKVILIGNTIYTAQDLSKLYQSQMNKVITVAQLLEIVQSITNFYRNNGYILTRAVLPPQHIQHGIVKIQIVEGYIGKVNILGTPKNAAPLLKKYGNNIQQSKPLQFNVMERYLYLANDIPGMHAQGVLEPSKSQMDGASDLNLIANQQTVTGYLTYDNFQSRYLGTKEVTGNLNLNSAYLPGDSMHFTYLTSTIPSRLYLADISYDFPVWANGSRILLGGNESITAPGFVLAPTNLNGDAFTYYGSFTYPYMRSRIENLNFDAGFVYADSTETFSQENLELYTDHIRSLKAGATYDFFDKFNGSNLITAHIEKGFPVLGATTDTSSLTTSRFGGSGNFVKFTGQATRLQDIYGQFALYGLFNFQWSPVPLLVYEQYGYGGATLGRGYDPAELLGDKGMAGSGEARYNIYPAWQFLQTIQFFIFYDIGVIYNLNTAGGLIKSKQSASSSGGGVRVSFNKYLSGTWTWAQPLTKQEATLEFIGRGRAPRILFNITATI